MDKIPFFVSSLVFGAITVLANSSSYAARVTTGSSFLERLAMPFVTTGFYLYKLLLPLWLCVSYVHPGRGDNLLSPQFLIYPFTLIALFIIAVRRYRKCGRKIIFGAAFFLIALLPCMQLVPVGWTLVSDRYVYIPSVGIFLIVGALWMRLYRQKRKRDALIKGFLVFVLAAVISTYSFLSYRRSLVWYNGFSLWSDAINTCPGVYAYFSRGNFYYAEGRFNEAISDFDRAIKINPGFFFAYHNRAVAYIKKGDYERAVRDLDTAIKFNIDLSLVYLSRGIAYSHLGETDEAISDFSKSIELSGGNKKAYYLRAKAYFLKGKYAQCRNDLRKAIELGLDAEPSFIEELILSKGDK